MENGNSVDKTSLNEFVNLKEWGEKYLIPQLNIITKQINDDRELDINYCRVETVYNDSYFSWVISCVTPNVWEKNDFCDVNEVVISINCQAFEESFVFGFDISFGDGDIFFEIPSRKIQINPNTSIIQMNKMLEVDVNLFLSDAFNLLRKGVLQILKMK